MTGLERIAELLVYPRPGWHERARACAGAIAALDPEAGSLLAAFVEQTQALNVDQLEELFTSTFDLNPVCSLEVGWHLFGEDYSRGAFLVRMREELRRHQLPESSELPDHLTHVLTVLERMSEEDAGKFAAACVQPALEKMLAGIAGKNNPYENVLKAVRCVINAAQAVPQEVAHD